MIIRRKSKQNIEDSSKQEKPVSIKEEKGVLDEAASGQALNPANAIIAEPLQDKHNASENILQAESSGVFPVMTPEMELQKKLEEVEKIDVTSLEFKERFERRRGERRRGYRRIDERSLVSRAQEEAQSIRELAAKEGYKTGIEEANEELNNLKNTLEELLGSKKEAYNALSDDILEISLEVARKIIKKEVELSGDVLKGVLSEVFEEVSSNEEKITIKVSPEELEFARVSMPEVLKNSQIDAKIVIIADEAVEKGSCVVITSNGVIDANFSTQLAIIQNAFGIYKGGV